MNKKITYTSENGYTGILYGKRSYAVQDKEGREVFHTGFRNINTFEELKEHVDNFPEFYRMITSIRWEKDDDR